MMTRREVILAGFGISSSLALPRALPRAYGEFWNAKKPEEWSDEEIRRMLRRSPWAKEVPARRIPVEARLEDGDRPAPVAVVRWETALPIRKARRNELAGDPAEFYVVSVSELSGMPSSHGGTTQITRDGKAPLHPVRIAMPQPDLAVLFLFRRRDRPIAIEDGEVGFETRIGDFEIKTRFILRDMIYKGSLEL